MRKQSGTLQNALAREHIYFSLMDYYISVGITGPLDNIVRQKLHEKRRIEDLNSVKTYSIATASCFMMDAEGMLLASTALRDSTMQPTSDA